MKKAFRVILSDTKYCIYFDSPQEVKTLFKIINNTCPLYSVEPSVEAVLEVNYNICYLRAAAKVVGTLDIVPVLSRKTQLIKFKDIHFNSSNIFKLKS